MAKTVVCSKQLRLAVETEEEIRERLDAATKRLTQVGHGYGRRKKSKTGEDGSYRTALVSPD